jgi:osmotically-inducible protein OsmY
MSRIATFVLGGAAGAAAAYFLDPQEGTRRRHVTVDKARSYARRGGEEAERKVHYAGGVARGVAHAGDSTQPGELDDVTLARKVETEIFRPADAPKGKIDVNAEDGIVYLRGEASGDQAEALVKAAREVGGVRGVKNLLHEPGQSPPAKEDAPVESA